MSPEMNPPQQEMKTVYYIHYGEGTYGPFDSELKAFNYAENHGWADFEIYDNFDDAQAAHEIECDR